MGTSISSVVSEGCNSVNIDSFPEVRRVHLLVLCFRGAWLTHRWESKRGGGEGVGKEGGVKKGVSFSCRFLHTPIIFFCSCFHVLVHVWCAHVLCGCVRARECD